VELEEQQYAIQEKDLQFETVKEENTRLIKELEERDGLKSAAASSSPMSPMSVKSPEPKQAGDTLDASELSKVVLELPYGRNIFVLESPCWLNNFLPEPPC
jgi:hypothetical protein